MKLDRRVGAQGAARISLLMESDKFSKYFCRSRFRGWKNNIKFAITKSPYFRHAKISGKSEKNKFAVPRLSGSVVRCDIPGEPITNWTHKLRLWIQINGELFLTFLFFACDIASNYVPPSPPQGHIERQARGHRKRNTKLCQLVRRQMVPVDTRRRSGFVRTALTSHFHRGADFGEKPSASNL